MNFWNILTADRKINPVGLRLFFSRARFAREDKRIRDFPLAPLPSVSGKLPTGGKGPVLFAVADLGYFTRFANMFASSAALSSPQSAVHIHVLGVSLDVKLPQIEKLPRHFFVTFEDADFSHMAGGLKGRYCQAMRFVRLAQFVRETGRDYVAFDIDGLFQQSFANFSDEFAGDIGLILRPRYSDPGLRANAGVVFMRATAVAQAYMQRASQMMLQHVQHAPYVEKLDQRCLALNIDEVVKPLPDNVYAFEPGVGYFYSAKGKAKNDVLQMTFERQAK